MYDEFSQDDSHISDESLTNKESNQKIDVPGDITHKV